MLIHKSLNKIKKIFNVYSNFVSLTVFRVHLRCSKCQNIFPFQSHVIFHWILFFYPFICQWTLGLLLSFGYCEWYCNEQPSQVPDFNYFRYILRNEMARAYGNIFNFSRNATLVSIGAAPFTFPSTVYRDSNLCVCYWLISLRMVSPRFIHIVACVIISFLFKAE